MPHTGEKRGNTNWVQCPGCEDWFPASPAMLAPDAPDLHCPHCHQTFDRASAARVQPPDGP